MSISFIVQLIIWAILTLGWSAVILDFLGKKFGAHVALEGTTRVVVFIVSGTILWGLLELIIRTIANLWR